MSIVSAHVAHSPISKGDLEIMPSGGNFSHSVNLNDRRAMDASEARRVELGLQFIHRHPQKMRAAGGVNFDVVPRRLNPVNIIGVDQYDLVPVLHGKTLTALARSIAFSGTALLLQEADHFSVCFQISNTSDV